MAFVRQIAGAVVVGRYSSNRTVRNNLNTLEQYDLISFEGCIGVYPIDAIQACQRKLNNL